MKEWYGSLMLTRKVWPSRVLTASKFHQQAETELFGLRTLFCLRVGDLVVTVT